MAGWWQRSKGRLAELRRRRVLRALGLYIVGGWLVLQVADVTFEPLGIPLWAQKALIIAVVAGIVPAAILAWVFDLTRHGLKRTRELAGPGGEATTRALAGPLAVDAGSPAPMGGATTTAAPTVVASDA